MLRGLFEREVDYLWSRLSRAATDRELLRPLWSRDGDPRMKRLVESAAYAFARVKEKIEDDLPEISHAIVASALPEVLRGMPSATIVQLVDPTRSRRAVTRDMGPLRFMSRPIDGAPCIFESSWPTTLAPLSLSSSKITSREAGVQTLTLRLEIYAGVSLAMALPPTLRLYVQSEDPLHALDVVGELCASAHPLTVRSFDKQNKLLRERTVAAPRVVWTAAGSKFRFYPGPQDRLASGSALRAFYQFPELYGFCEVESFAEALSTLDLGPDARALELTFRLRQPVREEAMDAAILLDCVPAVNVFNDVAALQDVREVGPCGTLVPAHHPMAEVFHVKSLRLVPTHQNSQDIGVRIWERDDAQALSDTDLFVKLDRRGAVGHGPTTISANLIRLNGASGVPHGSLHADLLVSDGQRTDALLRGDLALAGDPRSVNISRVTPPQPAVLDLRTPWRVNAFARMPVPRFARTTSLNDYLSLFDLAMLREQAGRIGEPSPRGVTSVRLRRVERVEDGAVEHGNEVDLVLDDAQIGGPGATWLVGELLARAISERADFLRYTHTRSISQSGTLRADYGVRQGERLPPPIG